MKCWPWIEESVHLKIFHLKQYAKESVKFCKMRLFLSTLLLVGAAVAQPSAKLGKGVCPRGSGGIGICVFNPEINCTGDEACESKGQLCCPDGCNRSCKDPIYPPPEDNQDVCPPTGVAPIGICTFDPKVNCGTNSDCSMGQVCCPSGCNSVCKDPIPRPGSQGGPRPVTPPSEGPRPVTQEGPRPVTQEGPRPVTQEGPRPVTPPPRSADLTCPSSGGSFGTCVFDPKTSCSGDGDCSNGKICCSKGCGMECVNPAPLPVHPGSKQ